MVLSRVLFLFFVFFCEMKVVGLQRYTDTSVNRDISSHDTNIDI